MDNSERPQTNRALASRLAYAAVWIIGLVVTIIGIVWMSMRTLGTAQLTASVDGVDTYELGSVPVDGWGLALLSLGLATLVALLLLEAFTGGPAYRRGK